jgi:hypothetical protein
VTFGHCGYPGLCVRGTTRAFCIGCPFLVRRPEYLDRVEFVLDGYLKAADAHEHMGDLAGARERHRLIAQLRQLRQEMLLLAEAERQGSWTPRWRELPTGTVAMQLPPRLRRSSRIERRGGDGRAERGDRINESDQR